MAKHDHESEKEFGSFVSQLCNELASRNIAAGMTEAEAQTRTARLLLMFSARIAANTRVLLLHGTPDKTMFLKAAAEEFDRIMSFPNTPKASA